MSNAELKDLQNSKLVLPVECSKPKFSPSVHIVTARLSPVWKDAKVDILLHYLHQIQLWPILQRLRQVYLGDCRRPRQICNCPAQLQHPVIGPRRQLELAHGRLHQQLTGFIQNAVLPDLRRAHISVGGDVRTLKSLPLALPGFFHPRPHISRRFTRAYIAQYLVFHLKHLHVDVNPVHQGS